MSGGMLDVRLKLGGERWTLVGGKVRSRVGDGSLLVLERLQRWLSAGGKGKTYHAHSSRTLLARRQLGNICFASALSLIISF